MKNTTSLKSILCSYGLLDDGNRVILNQKATKRMEKDMEWIEKLPVYYEFG